MAYVFIKEFAINDSKYNNVNGIADFLYFVFQSLGYPAVTSKLANTLKDVETLDQDISAQEDIMNRIENPTSAPMIVERVMTDSLPVASEAKTNLTLDQQDQDPENSNQAHQSNSAHIHITATEIGLFLPPRSGLSGLDTNLTQSQEHIQQAEHGEENNIVRTFSTPSFT